MDKVMDKDAKIMPLWKYTAISALGFGIGGALWGLEAYRGTVGSDEVFTNPFSYILGAIFLGIFGGLALAYSTQMDGSPFRSGRFLLSKHTLKVVGIGLIGWLVAFIVPAVGANWLFLSGSTLLPFLLAIFTIPLGFLGLQNVINVALEPSFLVGNFWLEFLISGVAMGAIYAFLLRSKVTKTALWAGIGFGIASIIGPILGNLIGNLFNFLLASYILTFLLTCVIFGVCLSVGMRRNSKQASPST